MDKETDRLEAVKNAISASYVSGDCGLFFSHNLIGDIMHTIYSHDGVTVDICYEYAYFEVFGLTLNEKMKLLDFYNTLGRKHNGHKG